MADSRNFFEQGNDLFPLAIHEEYRRKDERPPEETDLSTCPPPAIGFATQFVAARVVLRLRR
jgi:hypothetical protein